MKVITEKELLELSEIERVKVLKEICEGKIKYMGETKIWEEAEIKKRF